MHMIQEVEEPSITTFKNSEYYGNAFISNLIKKSPQVEKHFQKMVMKSQKDKVKKIQNHI